MKITKSELRRFIKEELEVVLTNEEASDFFDIDPKDWKNIDITKSYHKAREVIFESCKRVEIHAVPGESYIIHRMALHGVAPWDGRANSGKEGRVIIYFRPEADLGTSGWLSKP